MTLEEQSGIRMGYGSKNSFAKNRKRGDWTQQGLFETIHPDSTAMYVGEMTKSAKRTVRSKKSMEDYAD